MVVVRKLEVVYRETRLRRERERGFRWSELIRETTLVLNFVSEISLPGRDRGPGGGWDSRSDKGHVRVPVERYLRPTLCPESP